MLVMFGGMPTVAFASPEDEDKCHLTIDDPDLAIHHCTLAINSGELSVSDLAGAFFARGLSWAEKKEYDRAIADYNEAIRLNPQDAGFFNSRGDAWLDKKDYDRAIADFSEAIRLIPQCKTICLNLLRRETPLNSRCWARAIRGALPEALADCNESLRLLPGNADALDSRGLVHLKLRNYVAAIADYDAALRIKSEHAHSLYGRGLAKRAMGDRIGGEADATAARKIDPNIADEYKGYGVPGN